jgi:hypothetical protein
MPLNLAMSVMSVVEFFLWATLGFLFWRKALYRRFPAMGAYLALHVASTPFLLIALYIQSQPWGRDYLLAYFYTYWAVYIASAVLLFFICLEVFRSALTAFPGLMKFGTAIFRWAAVVSILVMLPSIHYANLFVHKEARFIPDIAIGLMRSVSILELCLLAFLCVSMNALRLSVRDMAFGIALGFGLMCSNDFLLASLAAAHSSLIGSAQTVHEALLLVSLGIWVIYCALPQTARKPMVMPANSTIYRWNEIASALGHTGTQVAVQQPANSFFLTDVEKVVEKVLTRNLKGRESEL